MPVRTHLLVYCATAALLWTPAISSQTAGETIDVAPLRYQPATPAQQAPSALPATAPSTRIRTPVLRYVAGPAATTAQSIREPTIRTPLLHYRTAPAADAAGESARMRYPSFDTGPVSTRRLAVDAATTSTGSRYNIRYRGLDPERRHQLHAWLTSARRERIAAEHSIAQGDTSGTWSALLRTAGRYRICLTPGDTALQARRSPDNAEECLEATTVWGDPAAPPEPVVSVSPPQPVAGEDFELSYAGMPRDANAKIFIYLAGAGRFAHPTDSVATDGRERGRRSLRIYDAGDYEIRVVFERDGRQTRATRALRIARRQQEDRR